MNDERPTEHTANPFEWFATNLQNAVYLLVGTATVGLGLAALVRWLLGRWQLGSELQVFLALLGLLLVPATLLLVVRRGKRTLVVGLVLFFTGVLAIGLASLGYSIPASWIG